MIYIKKDLDPSFLIVVVHVKSVVKIYQQTWVTSVSVNTKEL